jgi:hypothetical protein
MNNQHLLRGLFLIVIALIFGIGSFQYKIGAFSRAGPGLFPLVVSGLVGVLGLLMVIRSRFMAPAPVDPRFKNAALILASLLGFALTSHYLNMILGILVMVFLAALAHRPFNLKRNLITAAVLLAIAFAFQKFLGLNLPLIHH